MRCADGTSGSKARDLRRVMVIGLLVLGLSVTAAGGTARASVTFDAGPGTGPPPRTLGPYTMTPFGMDPQALFTTTCCVASPLGGNVVFAPEAIHLDVGAGFFSWSHGYTGDIYVHRSLGGTELDVLLPPGTTAFYFYARAIRAAVFEVTATALDGTTLAPIAVDVSDGARFFGFSVTGGSTLASITVDAPGVDYAVGEFGIASGPTTADQCKLGAWRNFAIFRTQGDCVSFVATNGRNEPARPARLAVRRS
jgi:hypothetical protein